MCLDQSSLHRKEINMRTKRNSSCLKDEKIKITCYGKTTEWESREKALAYFMEGIMCTEGSECARYTKIYSELLSGKTVCTDE